MSLYNNNILGEVQRSIFLKVEFEEGNSICIDDTRINLGDTCLYDLTEGRKFNRVALSDNYESSNLIMHCMKSTIDCIYFIITF